MTQIRVHANKNKIDDAIVLVEQEIIKRQIPEKNKSSFLLYCEEILLQLYTNSEKENETVTIRIFGKKDRVKASFSCRGKELIVDESFIAKDLFEKADFDDEQTVVISKMILKANTDKINVRYRRGINYAQVKSTAKTAKSTSLLVWMVGGLVLGLLIKLINIEGLTSVSSELFSIISTLFMNAIKMLVTPLVFFSIAESVTGFSDIGAFGKIGGKILLSYIALSILAMLFSLGVFTIFKPGNPNLVSEIIPFIGTNEIVQTTSFSLKNTIIDIIPSGFVNAFTGQNMMQIIFLAILTGFASSRLGQHSEKVQTFLSAGNSLFSELIAIVIKTLKPVCLCMMASMALSLTPSSFIQQFMVVICIALSLVCLVVLYFIFLAAVGKKNPFMFFKSVKKAFLFALSTMSSSATIPTSMQCCEDLGISSKVYSFSIPLGATINMNGSCVFYISTTLFVARIFGIPITFASTIPIMFTTLLLAMSAPGIPGAAIAFISILFAQTGIPAGAVGYIIGIYTITDGFLTAINILGDCVATYVVAKSENMIR